jgi:glycosyltransferase involved in cell wall biosynthesis
MNRSVSVVLPVKNGERYLAETLRALGRERVDEVLVIDSTSTDHSVEIARSLGAEVMEIAADAFGHGRTRNLAAEHTTGELVCFLTQDATPVEGWLDAYREAFALDSRVGAAYGPHLPRPETSPMIARELTEFFASFAPDGEPVVQGPGDPTFLSNVNACYTRACWEDVRFRDVPYAEDQAFGADLLAAGWTKVYHPRAAVLHAHDYAPIEFMRRYFDEYRGLRDTAGHVEPFRLRTAVGRAARSVAADDRWMRRHDYKRGERLAWDARAALHHSGRQVFSALGSRADRLPPAARRALSLEQRGDGPAPSAAAAPEPSAMPSPLPAPKHVERMLEHERCQPAADVWREGPVPLLEPVQGMADRERLELAMIIPAFTRGSGGHNTLFQVFSRLESRGHVGSVWIHDYEDRFRGVRPAVLRRDIIDFFAPIRAPVHKGFDAWRGADIVISTGWQTVHPALRLGGCRARVYVVNDHEPEFYATSTERLLAEDTYRHGLHCIAASRWLRDLLVDRYGCTADDFQLGVDHETYRQRPIPRRGDTVVYYARDSTPRRGVPIGLAALAELYRRRPQTRIVLFGTDWRIDTAFPYEHQRVLSPQQLSWLYSEATVGLCLSMTNFSLMPKEMLACGLPCVELEGVSAESLFDHACPLELAPLEPTAIADALERLLDDRELWQRRSSEGLEVVQSHSWDRATDEVEAGLRHALRLREEQAGVA